MQTQHSYSQDSFQNNHGLIAQEILSQQCDQQDSLGEKMDTVRRFTLLLGFAQATLANKYEKKHTLSKKLFNQITVTTAQNDDTKKVFQEMRLLQEEINTQITKVSRLASQLDNAEAALAKLIFKY